ncbi:hypothetical protein RNJ44_04331 [Nakaseomyces bracarensis]|uniref:Uncharacterized protein n=1 Tax=Nakaseomyces bracarensis TaxID=273131 RepID=A0ABR4NUM2_9SACH
MADNDIGLRRRNKANVLGAKEIDIPVGTDLYKEHLKQYGTRIEPINLDTPFNIAQFNGDSPTTQKSLNKSYVKEEPLQNDIVVSPNDIVEGIDDADDDQLEFPVIKEDLQLLKSKERVFSNGVADQTDKTAWKRRRRSSIKFALGAPLPLPYLTNNETDSVSNQNHYKNTKDIEKEKILDEKWNNIVNNNRKLVKERIDEIRNLEKQLKEGDVKKELVESRRGSVNLTQTEIGGNNFESSHRSYKINDDSIIIGTPEPEHKEEGTLDNIQHIVMENSKKLDIVLDTITGYDKGNRNNYLDEDVRPLRFGLSNINVEDIFWIGCIIVLLICNLYVYYYL